MVHFILLYGESLKETKKNPTNDGFIIPLGNMTHTHNAKLAQMKTNEDEMS